MTNKKKQIYSFKTLSKKKKPNKKFSHTTAYYTTTAARIPSSYRVGLAHANGTQQAVHTERILFSWATLKNECFLTGNLVLQMQLH